MLLGFFCGYFVEIDRVLIHCSLVMLHDDIELGQR